MRLKQAVITLLLCSTIAVNAHATDNPYLYKVSLVQAAPGKLLELIDLYKTRAAELKQAGDETPLWMRHSQGDHWDLMILFPVGSYAEYYKPERISKRNQAEQTAKLAGKFQEDIAWQEDVFAYGPPLADLRKAFAEGAFFHVEMFVSLPGKFAELYKEREMENTYAKALKEPENFIFVRDQGAAWDIFTIGVFRDYWEADKFKKYMREMGVKDAWIVPFKDGVRVEIKDVLEGVVADKAEKSSGSK